MKYSFTKTLICFVTYGQIAEKIVEVCGLNGDYRRKPFEQISRLIPMSDNMTFVTAVCRDTGSDAAFTMRLSNEKEQEVIGSTDKYQAVSRTRYLQSMDLGKNEKNQANQAVWCKRRTTGILVFEKRINECSFVELLQMMHALTYAYILDRHLKLVANTNNNPTFCGSI